MVRLLSALAVPPQLPALRPLHAAIAKRNTAPAEIVWWGDSVSEGTTINDPKLVASYLWQEMMRGAFPLQVPVRGGRGYVSAFYQGGVPITPWTVDLSANSGGTSVAIVDATGGLGAKGYALRFGAALQITEELTDFDVHYTKESFGTGFTVWVDGVQQGGTISTNAASITGGFIQSYTGFSPGEHIVRIQADSSGFNAVINGATFFYGDKNKGIHVYNAAKNGASASASFGVEHYRSLATLQPDCVIVQLITNDAIFLSSPATYKTNLITNFTNITSAMGSKPFTLIGLTVPEPNNVFVGGALWPTYVQAMKEALEGFSNSLFVNMADFMGPTVLGDPYFLWSDTVHPNITGHQMWADRLMWALCLNGGAPAVPVSNAYLALPYFKAGTLAVGSGKFPIYNDTAGLWTFASARADVGTAPTGAGIVCAVKVNGSTAFTITIPAGATTSGLVNPPTFPVAIGSKVTVDITQVGSTVPGADLSVTLTTQSFV